MRAGSPSVSYLLLILITFLMVNFRFVQAQTDDPIFACNVKGMVSCKISTGEKQGISWKVVNNGDMLTGECWIQIQDAQGEVTFIKKDGYQILKGKRITRIDKIIFEPLDSKWETMYKGLSFIFNPPQKKGVTAISKGEELQMLLPADGEQLLNDSITFCWKKSGTSKYYFLLTEMPHTDVWLCRADSLSDTFLTLPPKKKCSGFSSFDKSKIYSWGITWPGSKQSNFISFSFISDASLDSLKKDLAYIESASELLDTEIKILTKCALLEKYRMYSDAFKTYKTALKSNPDSKVILKAYSYFKVRIDNLNTL